MARSMNNLITFLAALTVVVALVGCGGGGGSSGSASQSSSALFSSQSSASLAASSSSLFSSSSSSSFSSASSLSSGQPSSAPNTVSISGRISYDFVPPNGNGLGLNYAATQVLPVRGATVELVNGADSQMASGVTDANGNYSLSVAANALVKVRVRAELKSTLNPSWNFTVKDNTSGNALYALSGSLLSSGSQDSVRDLHAASGWDGSSYSAARAAAPFAVLDQIYTALGRFQAAGNTQNFPALTFYWSPNNRPADGDLTIGEIGTSFYDSKAGVYLLGAADNDTDEYDTHVILHEWGHYIEQRFSRADTLGGSHPADARLDLRLALSEGFASAFAGMMLDDPVYSDSSGTAQASGFSFNLGRTNLAVKGWYSEFSVVSVLYNFYVQGLARDFTGVYVALHSADYINTPSMTSIFSLSDALSQASPSAAGTLSGLLLGQNINGAGIYGEGESNGALKSQLVLPVVAALNMGVPAKRCSTNAFFTSTATDNTLGIYSFARFSLSTAGSYSIKATRSSDTTSTTDPDIYLYKQGEQIGFAEGTVANTETLTQNLSAGNYLIELVDDKNRRDNIGNGDSCFDLVVQQN